MSWKVEKRAFTPKCISRITKLSVDKNRIFHDRYTTRKPTAGTAIDVEVALGTLALADLFKAGHPVDIAVLNLVGLVNESLVDLGSDPLRWFVRGSSEDELQFRNWLSQATGPAYRRRIQELLGVAERPANRFLILEDGQYPVTGMSLDDLTSPAKATVLVALDAVALANKIRAFTNDPLFTAIPR